MLKSIKNYNQSHIYRVVYTVEEQARRLFERQSNDNVGVNALALTLFTEQEYAFRI